MTIRRFVFILDISSLFQLSTSSAKQMRTWQGKWTSMDEWTTEKPGPKPKWSLSDQFSFYHGPFEVGIECWSLVDRFGVNSSAVSRTVITWINLMYEKLIQRTTHVDVPNEVNDLEKAWEVHKSFIAVQTGPDWTAGRQEDPLWGWL